MLKARSRLGKYRILRRIGEGGFAVVYSARDTIEGVDVALKVPHQVANQGGNIEELRREVRMVAGLDHPNILPIKNAAVIDGQFVIAYPLGRESLSERMARRLSPHTVLSFADQLIQAIAYAHEKRIIHCDIKPENIILFDDGRLRLGDFGIARVAMTQARLASGQGTIGYIAPEQAMGKPSCRSDIFSAGLLLYRLFSGSLPMWPYEWPPPGIHRARSVLHPDFLAVLQRCLEVDERKRYAGGAALATAFGRVRGRALSPHTRRSRVRNGQASTGARRRQPVGAESPSQPAWRSVRTREFLRRHGRTLEARGHCSKCHGPIAETMSHCPWCAKAIVRYQGPARFTSSCKRCGRGCKKDFRFCAHCYGPAIQDPSPRRYKDHRYTSQCGGCETPLMPFMRYCPGCRRRTRQRWRIEGVSDRCPGCGWGVVREFWDHCPWCGKGLTHP